MVKVCPPLRSLVEGELTGRLRTEAEEGYERCSPAAHVPQDSGCSPRGIRTSPSPSPSPERSLTSLPCRTSLRSPNPSHPTSPPSPLLHDSLLSTCAPSAASRAATVVSGAASSTATAGAEPFTTTSAASGVKLKGRRIYSTRARSTTPLSNPATSRILSVAWILTSCAEGPACGVEAPVGLATRGHLVLRFTIQEEGSSGVVEDAVYRGGSVGSREGRVGRTS